MGELAKWLLAGGGGATLVAAVQAFLDRKRVGAETEKLDADAAAVLSKTALELLEPLRKQVADLRQELGEATEQLDRVKSKADDLERQLDTCRASNRAKDEQIHALRQQRASEQEGHR